MAFNRGLVLALVSVSVAGCTSTYYGAMEKFGIEKRDILVDRVEDARDSQTEAREQFDTALERYRSVVRIDGGDLERAYDALQDQYEDIEDRADEVSDRIDAVESVAEDLFEEWDAELDEYTDPELRRRSGELLEATRAEYVEMIGAMRRAEERMAPVLGLFNDQVLFLRHNLNARAIGALEDELESIEQATAVLLADMQRSIDEASRFIESLR